MFICKKIEVKIYYCTDSLSTIKSILNISNTNFYTSVIRIIWIDRFPVQKLIHCRIVGNEFADNAAKNAGSQLVYFIDNFIRIQKSIRVKPIVITPQHTERLTRRKIKFMTTYYDYLFKGFL